MKERKIIVLAMIMGLVCSKAFAQDSLVSSFYGVVTDDIDSSYTIPNAHIFLKTFNGKIVAKTTTDFNGCYRFTELKPGKYYLECQAYGYYPVKVRKRFTLRVNEPHNCDLWMRDREKKPPENKVKDALSFVPAGILLIVGIVALL